MHLAADAGQFSPVRWLIGACIHTRVFDNQGFDFLVSQHGANATAARLLQTRESASLVVEADVQAAHERVCRARAR